ncbi:MAG: hypothetical protein JSU07_05470 [Bacteroidetes bacterium]|nr:hypothetical protein [Bacteroidota bacterium]
MRIFLFSLLLFSYQLFSQNLKTRYSIETTLDDKSPLTLDENYGSLVVSSSLGDVSFACNLAEINTGILKIDSLLRDKENIRLVFNGAVDQNLFKIARKENDDNYYDTPGSVILNGKEFQVTAQIRINNFSDRSQSKQLLIDLRLPIDAQKMNIPIFSDYFKFPLLINMRGNIVNQND